MRPVVGVGGGGHIACGRCQGDPGREAPHPRCRL